MLREIHHVIRNPFRTPPMPSFPRTQIPWLPGLMALGLTAACTPSHESAIPIAQTVQDARAPGDAIRLWADAALQPALQAIARQHEERAGQRVAFTFGPSAALRQRIAQGQEAAKIGRASCRERV